MPNHLQLHGPHKSIPEHYKYGTVTGKTTYDNLDNNEIETAKATTNYQNIYYVLLCTISVLCYSNFDLILVLLYFILYCANLVVYYNGYVYLR